MGRPKRAFVFFEDGDGSRSSPRLYLETAGDLFWFDSLKRGRRIKKPVRPPRLKINPPALRAQDMPCVVTAHVVSEPLRRFLRREAPRHAQYIEARLGPQRLLKPLDAPLPYSLVNWLKVVDCIDFKRSEYDVDQEPGEEPDYTFWRLRLDPRKVPDDALIFRLRHDELSVVIDARLADKIKAAGFTGPRFEPIGGIDDAMGL